MGEKALGFVKEKHSIEAIKEKYMKFFREVENATTNTKNY